MFCIRFVARYIHTFVYSMNATYVHAHNYGPAWPIVCGMNQYVGIYYTICGSINTLFQVPIRFDLCHCLGYWKQLGCNCE